MSKKDDEIIKGILIFFAHTRDILYEDVRRYIFQLMHPENACAYCGALTDTKTHVFACFLRGRRLCFTCWHRARWPR